MDYGLIENKSPMANRSQKEMEKIYFEMFQKHYSLPQGVISFEGEKPDIIIKGERKIGIEIINFYLEEGKKNSTSLQAQRAKWDATLKKAQEIYMKKIGRKIDITFSVNLTVPMRDLENLSKEIAELVMEIKNLEAGFIERNLLKRIPELYDIYYNPIEYENPKWRVGSIYSSKLMSREKLIEIVRKKENKAKYYQKCDAHWLLVIVDNFDPARAQEIRIDNFEKIKSDTFEKGFVYKTYFKDVLEII